MDRRSAAPGPARPGPERSSRMTVYKRGRTWTFHSWWIDAECHKRQRKQGGFRTRALAETAETMHMASVVQGTYVTPTGISFGEYLETRWLPSRAGKLKPSTVATYEYLVRAYV